MDPANEWRSLVLSLISHEGNAERLLYERDYGIPFEPWDTVQGYTQGYPQLQAYLEPDKQLPHLFRPWLKDKEGAPVGCPKLFVVVADNQGGLVPDVVDGQQTGWKSKPALDSDGFARLRREFPAIHIPQSEMGKPVRARRHFKKLDDAFDCARALAAQFFPAARELSEAQRLEAKLPAHFQRENLPKTIQQHGANAYYGYRAAVEQAQSEESEAGGPNWGVAGRLARRGNNFSTVRDARRHSIHHEVSPDWYRIDDDDDD
ncbi:MAG: hypothetical protein HY011_19025 [Acidobacteria bacterium]|nr:hypothetical protein [Acidobacteriota bacterium]